jgi:hypothetical protein
MSESSRIGPTRRITFVYTQSILPPSLYPVRDKRYLRHIHLDMCASLPMLRLTFPPKAPPQSVGADYQHWQRKR